MPRFLGTILDKAGSEVLGAPIHRSLTADANGTNVATAQPLLPGAAAINLVAAETYQFEAQFQITRAAGTTSHTTGLLFGGTATLASIDYIAQVSNPTGNILASAQEIMAAAATLLTVTAANIIATENLRIYLFGMLRVTLAGTLIPQFQYSVAPGGVPTVKRNSFINLYPLGASSIAAVN
jgi:hypothetical protein